MINFAAKVDSYYKVRYKGAFVIVPDYCRMRLWNAVWNGLKRI